MLAVQTGPECEQDTPSMQETRHRILTAAMTLYVEQGLRATSIKQVANAAEVNEITVYRQFPTKEDMQREVVLFAARELGRGTSTKVIDGDTFDAFRRDLVDYALDLYEVTKKSASLR